MSSVHQVISWAGHCNYATSKGGIQLFMESIAQEVASPKIRVNAIGPGAIKAPINRVAGGDTGCRSGTTNSDSIRPGRSSRRYRKGAVWLASDESDYLTGTTLFVDSGMTLYPGFATGGYLCPRHEIINFCDGMRNVFRTANYGSFCGLAEERNLEVVFSFDLRGNV